MLVYLKVRQGTQLDDHDSSSIVEVDICISSVGFYTMHSDGLYNLNNVPAYAAPGYNCYAIDLNVVEYANKTGYGKLLVDTAREFAVIYTRDSKILDSLSYSQSENRSKFD